MAEKDDGLSKENERRGVLGEKEEGPYSLQSLAGLPAMVR